MNTRKFRKIGGFEDNTAYVEVKTDNTQWRIVAKEGTTLMDGETVGDWLNNSPDRNHWTDYTIEFSEDAVNRGVWEEIEIVTEVVDMGSLTREDTA